MRKLTWVSAIFLALGFSGSAWATQPVDLIAGPLPLGTSSTAKGARCEAKVHEDGTKTVRIRGVDGTVVASKTESVDDGDVIQVDASFFALRAAAGNQTQNTRAVCEIFPIDWRDQSGWTWGDPDVTATLSSINNSNEAVETVEAMSGFTGN